MIMLHAELNVTNSVKGLLQNKKPLGENTVVKCGSLHVVKTQFKAEFQNCFSWSNIMHAFVIKIYLDQYCSLKSHGVSAEEGCNENYSVQDFTLGFACSPAGTEVQRNADAEGTGLPQKVLQRFFGVCWPRDIRQWKSAIAFASGPAESQDTGL